MDEADFEGSKAALDAIRGLGPALTQKRLLDALRPAKKEAPAAEPVPDKTLEMLEAIQAAKG